MGKLKILTDGLVKENPVLRLVLGTCPTLALTTAVSNAFGMGFAATFVLVCSNIAISALRKVIPGQVRLPAYITVIATFVTIVQNLVKAYFPDLDAALGVYLPLIVVNCIILGRAEMFASKNGVVDSALDGVGMGLGFTLALLLMSTIREVLGAGTWYGIQIIPESIDRFTFMTSPAGGFFTFGLLMALVVFIETKLGDRRKRSVGCEGCPSKGACGAKGGCE
ncbi:MAG TPA: electron transport complex subunit E [Candidatus Fournierella excrementigallinarum]|uniref:Ion-translocating oxidoreductase complex subunit E n=1 Tax=Candidatus Allofournierella pullicola TaxID=2838596 RepID=A0A9D1V3U0_9FIRM|nr:electron transport complex subunit E [Fournierella sp.]MEE0756090.1 electron transport complex subunit E [Fournierella sp.]HIX05566.1 electron transport complex subunit E [Candidatus Fournierella pullicola]HJB68666.1 electron transport complex subunit E [Candidatus Fournierella excrementigallinarum]